MTLKTYINKSPDNKIEKDLQEVVTFTGYIKENTDLLNPSFTIHYTNETLPTFNYLFCEETQRFYFITDLILLKGKVYQIDCHVDVLMSWKEYILSQEVITSRQENQFNLLLPDSEFKTYANPAVIQKAFPAGFSNDGFILLTVAGGVD